MIHPLFAIDFYKADHRRQYPEGTTEVYSNLTARYTKGFHVDEVVFFGLQNFINQFFEINFATFFSQRLDIATNYKLYQQMMNQSTGANDFDTSHLQSLQSLGYLPIEIKAVPEGELVPIGIPMLTIRNTHPEFFWLTNYLETVLSASLWKPITVATIARQYRVICEKYADFTCDNKDHVKWQCHDFSMRGMSGLDDAGACGMAHLSSFHGTDCVPAIIGCTANYNSPSFAATGGSIPATEHSVMCAYGEQGEFEAIKRLITEVYPSGMVSIVSDTYNLWHVIDEYLHMLKDIILNRDGKVVIRPDSGDPLEIICGHPRAPGALERLWNIFGGSINNKGYKVLNPKIGLIYGDSITLSLAQEILKKMEEMGFASSNVVFGIGSYSYQYITRDTLGMAIKATSIVVNGERRAIFKDPVTDTGNKKSARGLLQVYKDEDTLKLAQDVTEEQEQGTYLKTVYKDGILLIDDDLQSIRDRITKGI